MADYAQGVVQGPLDLIGDVLGAPAHDYADGLRVLAAGDEYHVVLPDLPLLDQLGHPEVVLGQVVYLADDGASSGLGDLLHIGLLQPSGGEYPGLGEVVLHQVVDALLAEYYVRAQRP